MEMQIEQKTPLILELFNQRQDQLNEALKERSTVGNWFLENDGNNAI